LWKSGKIFTFPLFHNLLARKDVIVMRLSNARQLLTKFHNKLSQIIDTFRHWITGVWEDEERQVWYQLTDEWLWKFPLHVPAAHIRPVPVEEFTPLASQVPAEARRIEVSLSDQTLTAFEEERVVLSTRVSTGRRWMETPKGEFYINRKMPSKHMGNGSLTDDLDAFELLGVPWVCFFHTTGVSFHGTYWHDNFGAPMSQGCVNMRIADARWLFRWCTPAYQPIFQSRKDWLVKGKGTLVKVY
jgi:hypothetical protein